jgi:hypothetical protein
MRRDAQRGRTVSSLLRRAWLASPERREEPADLASIEEILIRSGTAPLAWHALRSKSAAADRLHDAWRMSRLQAARGRRRAAAAVAFFADRGIETLLIKGWAVACLYPEPALRPYTDTDLAAGPERFERAEKLLAELPEDCGPVDLHALPEEWRDREWRTLVARAVRERVEDRDVLIPSPEDHLRLLAIHAMKHGIFRPLWLCDLGVALESSGTGFDWANFCSGDRWLTECALVALRLAGSLLGAKLEGTPAAWLAPPAWAEAAVLKEWSDPRRWPHGHAMIGDVVRRHPYSLVRELARRWPGAVEATYNLRAPWTRLPRLPLQLAEAVRKLPAIPRQLRRMKGKAPDDGDHPEA